MTTNPKILYSPIGSEVDKVIQKASSDSEVFQGWKSLTVSIYNVETGFAVKKNCKLITPESKLLFLKLPAGHSFI